MHHFLFWLVLAIATLVTAYATYTIFEWVRIRKRLTFKLGELLMATSGTDTLHLEAIKSKYELRQAYKKNLPSIVREAVALVAFSAILWGFAYFLYVYALR
jgi:hypothetical protein